MHVLLLASDRSVADFLLPASKEAYINLQRAADTYEARLKAKTVAFNVIAVYQSVGKTTLMQLPSDLRARAITCPLLLIGQKLSVDAIVTALETGYDDCINWPCAPEEFIAHVRVLSRRPALSNPDTLTYADITVNRLAHEVTRGGRLLKLTRKEFLLLDLLVRQQGNVVSRSAILDYAWDMNAEVYSNTLETHILNLRKKLNEFGRKNLIHTITGHGYRLA
jgi:two-component system OmpR family response regulator